MSQIVVAEGGVCTNILMITWFTFSRFSDFLGVIGSDIMV